MTPSAKAATSAAWAAFRDAEPDRDRQVGARRATRATSSGRRR